MTKGNKILLGIGIIGITAGYLYYRSKQNEKEGQALLDVINGSMTQNDLNKATGEGIQQTKALKPDPTKIAIGNLKGNMRDKKISDAMAKLNVELASAMMGAGTNKEKFFGALKNIRSKNTLNLMDQVFKAQYKEGLFEMMKGEQAIFNPAFGKFSDKTNNLIDTIPGLNEGYWNPALAQWINRLPNY